MSGLVGFSRTGVGIATDRAPPSHEPRRTDPRRITSRRCANQHEASIHDVDAARHCGDGVGGSERGKPGAQWVKSMSKSPYSFIEGSHQSRPSLTYSTVSPLKSGDEKRTGAAIGVPGLLPTTAVIRSSKACGHHPDASFAIGQNTWLSRQERLHTSKYWGWGGGGGGGGFAPFL